MKNAYHVIGLMSGTSLDGLDIAHNSFEYLDNKWIYKINNAQTIKYSAAWLERLSTLESKSAFEFAKTDMEFGKLLGLNCIDFIKKHNISVDFISSHGHTIFHQPEIGLTYQIGSGANIAALTKLPVVCDFRSIDVSLKGQGAPLVPIGDKLLFSEYEYRLNLGGFANISFEQDDKTLAFDICPVNMASNYLSGFLNREFDESGAIARSGTLNLGLLDELNHLNFYSKAFPKSLGKEWYLEAFKPIIDSHAIPINDKLRTVAEHVAIQIGKHLVNKGRVLVSGGGAYNTFLLERLKDFSKCEIIVPTKHIIEYKEALIFSFLGLLRWLEKANCLKSVTDAEHDHIGGAIYKPFKEARG